MRVICKSRIHQRHELDTWLPNYHSRTAHDDVAAVVRAPRGGTDEEETPAVEDEEADGKEPERIGRTAKEAEEKTGD